MTSLREKVLKLLDDAKASSSSNPEGSAPEGFGGVIRADAEVVAILCRRFLAESWSPHVTIDESVLQELVHQVNGLDSLRMRQIVWARLEGAKIVEAKVLDRAEDPPEEWLSLGLVQVVLKRGMVW